MCTLPRPDKNNYLDDHSFSKLDQKMESVLQHNPVDLRRDNLTTFEPSTAFLTQTDCILFLAIEEGAAGVFMVHLAGH